MIEPIKITVWDYDDKIHGSMPYHSKENYEPVEYEVEAYCVGGQYGIKAFFYIGNKFCEANGDDGHWWLISSCHEDWVEQIKKTLNSVSR